MILGFFRIFLLSNYDMFFLAIIEYNIMILNSLKSLPDYYNSKRPHQGIDQRVPMGYKPQLHIKVLKFRIPGALCHYYVMSAA